jgi:hypothetical protein
MSMRTIAGSLDHHEAEAAERELAVVDEVIVGCEVVYRLVLAHGRNREAVTQGHRESNSLVIRALLSGRLAKRCVASPLLSIT